MNKIQENNEIGIIELILYKLFEFMFTILGFIITLFYLFSNAESITIMYPISLLIPSIIIIVSFLIDGIKYALLMS